MYLDLSCIIDVYMAQGNEFCTKISFTETLQKRTLGAKLFNGSYLEINFSLLTVIHLSFCFSSVAPQTKWFFHPELSGKVESPPPLS